MLNKYYNSLKYSGPYLGVLRNWIQRKFRNGEYVTWGSDDVLEGCTMTPYLLEMLAFNIRDAVVQEFKIKDKDHIYKYAVVCVGSGKFIQKVDTSKEAWTALFDLWGGVFIVRTKEDGSPNMDDQIFQGDVEEAKQWVRKNKIEDIESKNSQEKV